MTDPASPLRDASVFLISEDNIAERFNLCVLKRSIPFFGKLQISDGETVDLSHIDWESAQNILMFASSQKIPLIEGIKLHDLTGDTLTASAQAKVRRVIKSIGETDYGSPFWFPIEKEYPEQAAEYLRLVKKEIPLSKLYEDLAEGKEVDVNRFLAELDMFVSNALIQHSQTRNELWEHACRVHRRTTKKLVACGINIFKNTTGYKEGQQEQWVDKMISLIIAANSLSMTLLVEKSLKELKEYHCSLNLLLTPKQITTIWTAVRREPLLMAYSINTIAHITCHSMVEQRHAGFDIRQLTMQSPDLAAEVLILLSNCNGQRLVDPRIVESGSGNGLGDPEADPAHGTITSDRCSNDSSTGKLAATLLEAGDHLERRKAILRASREHAESSGERRLFTAVTERVKQHPAELGGAACRRYDSIQDNGGDDEGNESDKEDDDSDEEDNESNENDGDEYLSAEDGNEEDTEDTEGEGDDDEDDDEDADEDDFDIYNVRKDKQDKDDETKIHYRHALSKSKSRTPSTSATLASKRLRWEKEPWPTPPEHSCLKRQRISAVIARARLARR